MSQKIVADREKVKKFIETKHFDLFILMLICINSVTLGMMTSPYFNTNFGGLLFLIDRLCLAIFIVEMVLKIYVYGREFFTSKWNVFDFSVVAVSSFSFASSFIIFRAFRLFRILKYINRFSRLKHILGCLRALLPNFVAFALIFGVFLYVFAIISVNLFGQHILNFESLPMATLTLLQVFTLDGWAQITHAVMRFYPHSWVFFVSYLMISIVLMLSFIMSMFDEIIKRNLSYRGKPVQHRFNKFQKKPTKPDAQ